MRETMALRTVLVSSFLLLPGALAAVENDFSMYPSDAESCLYSAASGSGCDGDTVPEMNACLCGNKKDGWVALVADCLGGTGVASSTIADTYSQMETNCGDSDTPLGLTREEFFNHVDAASSDTTTTKKDDPTTTATDDDSKQTTQAATSEKTTVVVTVSGEPSTMTTVVANTDADYTGTDSSSSPTSTGDADGEEANNNDDDEGGGLSNTAKIGIIAGCVGAALVGIIAAVYIIMRRRLRAAKEARAESHPMLPGQQPTAFPPTDPTLPSQSISPNPSAMYGGSPVPHGGAAAGVAAAAGGMYKDDDKWRPQSAAWTPQSQQTTAYTPQTQWAQQQQMQPGPYGAPPPAQQQFVAAELPDNQDHQLYELGDSAPRGPYQPGRQ